MKNKIIPFILFSTLFATQPVYAATAGTMSIVDILDPIIRLLNLITGAASFVFLAMLFYSAYKYAIAQGDPKGLMGAKETLTHAIFGFIIAIGSFAIINWVSNLLGLNTAVLNDPSSASKGAIQELIDFIYGE